MLYIVKCKDLSTNITVASNPLSKEAAENLKRYINSTTPDFECWMEEVKK